MRNKPVKRASPRARLLSVKWIGTTANRGHDDQAEHYLDHLLDDALEQTFPASDAIALVMTHGNS
jgi:hypothetical protein